ncbi:MAG: gliding motility-associated C-terminal domain-containing protein, partial [Crocinitomicaceae bacterium]
SFIDSIEVTETQLPTVSLGNDTTICVGNSVIINSNVQLVDTYLWSTNETTSSITTSLSGTYWLEGTNICGSDSDTIDISVEQLPVFSLGNDTTLCAGSSVTLVTSVPNTTTTWQDGSQATTFVVNQAGTYSAIVAGQVCVSQDDIQITFSNEPDLQLGADTVICEDEQFFLTASSSNGSILWGNGSQESTIAISEGGIYNVTSTNGCGQISDQIEIQTRNCSCEVYIPNSFTPDDGNFNEEFGPVHVCEMSEYSFRIFNRWGEVIFESSDPLETWDATYKGRKVQVGVYTYQLLYSTEGQEDVLVTGHVNVLY